MLVIDLGCGWLKYPATMEKPHLKLEGVIGVDLCKYNNDVVADALKAPLRNEIADMVVMSQLLEHVDAVSLIREAWRILKPNGTLYLATPNALYVFRILRALYHKEANPYPEHIQIFTAPELRNLLRRNGFTQTEISYRDTGVSSSNAVFYAVKKTILCITNNLFPMLKRDIRAVAVKDSTRCFKEY